MKHRTIPLEDFFRNARQTAFQLSPDGQRLSYLAPYEGRMNLYVRPLQGAGGKALRLTGETRRSLGGYLWASDHRLLYMKDTDGDENYHLYGINADGSEPRAYTEFPGVRVGLIDALEDRPGEVIIGMNRRNPEAFDPYRLDLQSGQLTLLAENPGHYQGWLTDQQGRLRAATAVVGTDTQLLYRDTEEEPFRVVLTVGFKDTVSWMAFTPDGRYVWAASNLGRDKLALVLMDPHTGRELEVIYEHPRYDISNISYSRRRKKLIGVFCTGHKDPVRHYFDPYEEQLREHLKERLEGRPFGLADEDRSEEHRLIYAGGDRTRGSYYYYNTRTDELRLLAEVAPWLSEEELVPMHPVAYTTRDGLHIEAYLSLPYGLDPDEARGLPVVVNPHGGPWARDSWGYSSEVQFLCNRGYAVMQMNFRGSTGYGRRFLEASYKQWGRAMQDDISDAVRWLTERGIADPRRVAIYGGSYGGYATLAGLAFTPELYACGVDYVGVSNLLTFMNTIPPYWRPMLEMMHEQVGDPETDRDLLEACSPALHADRIQAPLFIAQGANDPRVNKAESDQMVEALRRRGVEVEYMVKDDEGHGFANEENRFDFYRAMERFLERHLHPHAPRPTAGQEPQP